MTRSALEGLEPYDGKLSYTVLGGERARKGSDLPGCEIPVPDSTETGGHCIFFLLLALDTAPSMAHKDDLSVRHVLGDLKEKSLYK